MVSNVISQWLINYKRLITLEAIMLAIMYLVLTSDYLFVLWHRYRVGCEEFHTQKQLNQFPMRTKQWVFNRRKGHNFQTTYKEFSLSPHINNLASYGELFAG